MITLDRLGVPIEVGDTVTYSTRNDRSFGTTFSVEWYEGIVKEIKPDKLAYHNGNKELVILFKEYSEQTIISNPEEFVGKPTEYDDEVTLLQSNSVINKGKIMPAVAHEFAEYFV